MRRGICLVVISAAFAYSWGAEPQASDHDKAVEKCMQACEYTAVCMSSCELEENEKLDAELNSVYKSLRVRLKGTLYDKQLVEAERKWLRDREKKCREDSEADYDNDEEKNAAHMAIGATYQACIQEETQVRVDYLKDTLTKSDKDGLEKFRLE
jgi:uncharacterized protein YecT (DUF1311 family)